MKKIFILIILFFCIDNVSAEVKTVYFSRCVDGDTAYLMIDNIDTKVRLLAIDTPEYTTKIEPYGKEASEYTCNALETAKTIEIEYDKNSNKTDLYDRDLVWIFVDDILLQDKLINEGLAEVAYLYGDYKYTDILKTSLLKAQINKVGMWKNINNSVFNIKNIILVTISIITVSIIFIKNKNNKKLLKSILKQLKKVKI